MSRRPSPAEEIPAMLSLKQQMQSYGAYHRDPRNKMTHFFGVPLVTFSLFLFLGWFRFVHPEALLLVADWVAKQSMALSFSVFLTAFVLGWIIQLVGHAIEGRRPALADNILQVFNAPLFLTIEALAFAGFRKDLLEPEAVPELAGTAEVGMR